MTAKKLAQVFRLSAYSDSPATLEYAFRFLPESAHSLPVVVLAGLLDAMVDARDAAKDEARRAAAETGGFCIAEGAYSVAREGD